MCKDQRRNNKIKKIKKLILVNFLFPIIYVQNYQNMVRKPFPLHLKLKKVIIHSTVLN